ncbi:MAG TPA: hypothetical protein VHX86_17285 [Tepidisphaeraceae bacterium]|jgi:hypothetical protein|nr:hypothetical protein [Tepidisphaeraceae bacterium]
MATDVPIAFFLFNRPEPTQRVFAEIARARPSTLLIIADGPRSEAERAACEAARHATDKINWACDVRRNYSETNLGCRRRMYSGIDWVFSQHERAILLEDDCLPHPTFFRFCTELLDFYRDDERVMMISGDNMQQGRRCTPYSYYFSVMTHIWGWATWRRAWEHHDAAMSDWPQHPASEFPGDFVPCAAAQRHYRKMMDETYTNKLDTWDLAWMYAVWKRRGLTVLPEANLISNIGYGPGATHTKKLDPFAALPTEAMQFPLRHPPEIKNLLEADQNFFNLEIKELRERLAKSGLAA